jgi:CheY-like chemotaxis protein
MNAEHRPSPSHIILELNRSSAVQRPRILLVDDEPACVQALKAFPATRGRIADSASEAGDVCTLMVSALTDDEPYRLVITDFEMSVTNGVDLFPLLREDQRDIEGFLVTEALTDERRAVATQDGMMSAFGKAGEKAGEYGSLLSIIEDVSQQCSGARA